MEWHRGCTWTLAAKKIWELIRLATQPASRRGVSQGCEFCSLGSNGGSLLSSLLLPELLRRPQCCELLLQCHDLRLELGRKTLLLKQLLPKFADFAMLMLIDSSFPSPWWLSLRGFCCLLTLKLCECDIQVKLDRDAAAVSVGKGIRPLQLHK